jgi:putative PIN family toxin of toxin-antitoxin system
MKFVLDTDVVVAGLRSPTGASAELLRRALNGELILLISVALALEYESICQLPEHRLASNASQQDIQNLLDALMGKAIPVNVHYQWRPQLRDAADEMVLEAAVNGGANAIISFNHRDYGAAPQRFAVQLLTPKNFLRDFLRKVQP